MYRLNECAKVDKVDDQYEWMIRYSAQNNPDNIKRQQLGGHGTDFNQLTDKFMSDLDFDDSGEYSLSSMATGVSEGTTTSTACFDSSSHCTCCDDENISSFAHDNEASGNFCGGNQVVNNLISQNKQQQSNLCPTHNSMQESRLVNAAVTDDNPGCHKLYRRTGGNLKAAAATTTTADEDFEAILHRYEFKPNKVPFRRFTLDDIADDAGQQSTINAVKNTSSAKQVVGTFSRPVIVDQLRESEIQFEEEMEKTIRKLQKMERKLKEFDDSDYHTSELSLTTPPLAATGAITKVQQHHHQNRKNINKLHPYVDVEERSFQQSNKVNKKNEFSFKDSINSQQIPYSLSPSSTSSPFTMKPNNNNNNVKFEDSNLRRDDNSPSLSLSSLDRLIGGQAGSSTRIFGVQQHHHNPNTNTSTGVDYSMQKKTFKQSQLLGADHLSAVSTSSSSAAFSSDFNFEGILKTSLSPSPPPQQPQPQQQQQQQKHANRVKGTRRKLPSLGKEEDSRDSVSSKNQLTENTISTNKPRPKNRVNRKKKKRSPRQLLSADVNLGYEAEIEEAEDTV